MKRVLPLVIIATLAKFVILIWLGIYLFKCRPELGGENIADSHIVLSILYIIYTGCSGIFMPLNFIALDDMYSLYREPGQRFKNDNNYIPFTLIELWAPIFNYIDAFDFTWLKNKWLIFWGYK